MRTLIKGDKQELNHTVVGGIWVNAKDNGKPLWGCKRIMGTHQWE